MKVLLHPYGSHGDVHPFIGLGRALRDRGHQVTVITASPFRDLAEQQGFEFAPIGTDDDYRAITLNPDLWHPKRALNVLFGTETYSRGLRQAYHYIAERYEPGNTVLVAGTLGLAARIAQDALGIPLVTVDLQPVVLQSVVDPAILPAMRMRKWWPHWLRKFVYWAGDRFYMDPLIGPPLNSLRAEHGLPPVSRIWSRWRQSPQMILGLFPDWFATAPDWPKQLRTLGFIRYDQGESQTITPALRAFLDNGKPPIMVSFGSAMRLGRPYFQAAIEACSQLGLRGVLLAKGEDQIPTPLPPDFLHVEYAPFSQVFPHASAVIHHGGIGTTSQALAAGVPQLIMPMAHDQPDNADRLARLGVARYLFPASFSGKNVAKELRELLESSSVKAACHSLADQIQNSDPMNEACHWIEQLKGTDRSNSPLSE